MKTEIKTYHRPDGVVGCGFYGEFGGLWQHSIAWPDQSATRMRFEDLQERQIAVKDLAVVPIGKRDLIDMADQPGEGYAAGCVDYVKEKATADQKSHPLEDWIEDESYSTDRTPTDDVPGSVDPVSGEVTQAESTPVDPPALEDANPFDKSKSEAENIRIALGLMPSETNKGIIEVLNSYGIDVASSQVTRERKAMAKAAEETESSE